VTAAPVLRTEGLTKRFAGFVALSQLTLDIVEGEVRGVIGPNGAGKTTLFNLISGHLKPSAGAVFYRGEAITGLAPHAVARRGVARKFQIAQIFATLSVEENVTVAAFQEGSPSILGLLRPRPVRVLVDATLERVRLSDRRAIDAASLSHGEQQRLELAMVLATGAGLLLLDEPTAGMSSEERAVMAQLIKDISATRTIVIIEHDFTFIKTVADRVTVLNNGAKLAEGTLEAIENDAAVRECYLGPDDA
jgi:branched-chain amino acid transport system ATP-binding protein